MDSWFMFVLWHTSQRDLTCVLLLLIGTLQHPKMPLLLKKKLFWDDIWHWIWKHWPPWSQFVVVHHLHHVHHLLWRCHHHAPPYQAKATIILPNLGSQKIPKYLEYPLKTEVELKLPSHRPRRYLWLVILSHAMYAKSFVFLFCLSKAIYVLKSHEFFSTFRNGPMELKKSL